MAGRQPRADGQWDGDARAVLARHEPHDDRGGGPGLHDLAARGLEVPRVQAERDRPAASAAAPVGCARHRCCREPATAVQRCARGAKRQWHAGSARRNLPVARHRVCWRPGVSGRAGGAGCIRLQLGARAEVLQRHAALPRQRRVPLRRRRPITDADTTAWATRAACTAEPTGSNADSDTAAADSRAAARAAVQSARAPA